MKTKTNYKAFTLAEVLITLAIIGVVAALVIPTTISKVNRLQVETGLPVAYQNLKQIITAAEHDEGPLEEWDIRSREKSNKTNNPTYAKDAAENYFAPYVHGARYEYKKVKDFGYENGISVAKDGSQAFAGKFPIMMLPNGMIAIFVNATGTKNVLSMASGTNQTIALPSSGLKIYVDINGLKKPNSIGKDIFDFQIYIEEITELSMAQHLRVKTGLPQETWEGLFGAFRNGQYRFEISEDSYVIRMCTEYANGCGAWIMRNGWKIPDHYPYL